MTELRARIRAAWEGRISGCQLGKPVEILSMRHGWQSLHDYLAKAGSLPLRDYVPCLEDTLVARIGRASCRGHLTRSEPDDDINYTALALLMLEEHGLALETADVARSWLHRLPIAATFTAERAAYRTLAARADDRFMFGAEAGFDLAACAENEWNDWIGAQIRADLYGWVCPGRPALAADLARRDAELSHRGEGVYGAVFVAALGAALPSADSLDAAIDDALAQIPADSACAEAVAIGRANAGKTDGPRAIRERYAELSPVHTLNNLALVVWALVTHADDFGAAIGDVVSAGLDTDCNGATVGALWGLHRGAIPSAWTEPWQGRVALTLAGLGEISLDELVERTVALAKKFEREA